MCYERKKERERGGGGFGTRMNPSRSKVVDWNVNMKRPVTMSTTTPI